MKQFTPQDLTDQEARVAIQVLQAKLIPSLGAAVPEPTWGEGDGIRR